MTDELDNLGLPHKASFSHEGIEEGWEGVKGTVQSSTTQSFTTLIPHSVSLDSYSQIVPPIKPSEN